MQSYYDVLGVAEDAETEEIEAAFRDALASAQEEADEGDAADVADQMRLLVEAYQVLSNPAYRAAYDVKRAKKEPFPVPKPVAGSKLFRALKAGSSTFVKDVKEQYENDPTIKEDFDRSIQLGRKVARAARFLRFLR
ncbi:MAG: DnaJ domain-containing protein [Chloroflexota bacterium]|nr:DnaJ domain-containing protein [Chloroflexota bacterium]MDE2841107.1 DnaJ domain-containing protein [Chloroflexota bacterium]MDE2930335.1 DnaJ domain-containing protein [Chloroflexota bacterium]